MREAYAVVVVFRSRHRTGSRRAFTELLDAIADFRQYQPGSIFLILVRLSPCEIPLLEIDDTRTLDRIHAIDLFPEEGYQRALERLIRAVHAAGQRLYLRCQRLCRLAA